jgi:hypothetical protein
MLKSFSDHHLGTKLVKNIAIRHEFCLQNGRAGSILNPHPIPWKTEKMTSPAYTF